MKQSILPYLVIALLFIGCLALAAEGRRSYRDDDHRANNTSANGTTTAVAVDGDESKLFLKFCAARDCDTKGEPYRNTLCICCLVLPDVPCWDTVEMCQDNCPAIGSQSPTTGELRA